MNLAIKAFPELDDRLLHQLENLDRAIFPEPLAASAFAEELERRRGLLVLIASLEGGAPCAYKIGFAYSSSVFLSWSGGVCPPFRKRGIASALIREQHRRAKDLGYGYVRTHTKNKYREMLLLNIRSGFDVTGVYKSLSEKQMGIVLEKCLD